MDVRCRFYERVEVEGGFRYNSISLGSQRGDGMLATPTPPAVGDLIHLWGIDEQGPRGLFVVRERSWKHSSWGSANWPYNEPAPTVGPILDIIVERAEGLFRDEVPSPDED